MVGDIIDDRQFRETGVHEERGECTERSTGEQGSGQPRPKPGGTSAMGEHSCERLPGKQCPQGTLGFS